MTANYTARLSASMEGGESPLKEYHGEIRVGYEARCGDALRHQRSKGKLDAEGRGENDAYSFTMEPYDRAATWALYRRPTRGRGEIGPGSPSIWMRISRGRTAIGDVAGRGAGRCYAHRRLWGGNRRRAVYTPFGSGFGKQGRARSAELIHSLQR